VADPFDGSFSEVGVGFEALFGEEGLVLLDELDEDFDGVEGDTEEVELCDDVRGFYDLALVQVATS
jgi:hypothetical protein